MTVSDPVLNDSELKSVIEAAILASVNPLTVKAISAVTNVSDHARIDQCIRQLIARYEADPEHGIYITPVAGGFQFRTKPENSRWIRKLAPEVARHLSRKAMTTLAIIAYKQPITRAEIDNLRGAESGGIIRQLMAKDLIKMVGKKEIPGKPFLYGTTDHFLETVGIRDLKDLPPLREFEDKLERETTASEGDTVPETAALFSNPS